MPNKIIQTHLKICHTFGGKDGGQRNSHRASKARSLSIIFSLWQLKSSYNKYRKLKLDETVYLWSLWLGKTGKEGVSWTLGETPLTLFTKGKLRSSDWYLQTLWTPSSTLQEDISTLKLPSKVSPYTWSISSKWRNKAHRHWLRGKLNLFWQPSS